MGGNSRLASANGPTPAPMGADTLTKQGESRTWGGSLSLPKTGSTSLAIAGAAGFMARVAVLWLPIRHAETGAQKTGKMLGRAGESVPGTAGSAHASPEVE